LHNCIYSQAAFIFLAGTIVLQQKNKQVPCTDICILTRVDLNTDANFALMMNMQIYAVYMSHCCNEREAIFNISTKYAVISLITVYFHLRLQQGLQDKGYEEWVGEMIGMREILRQFANISKSDVVGMRAPYLKPGRNTQYEV
jgi:hypothetical protein